MKSLSLRILFFVGLGCCFFFCSASSFATPNSTPSTKGGHSSWQSAVTYCKAARGGDTEAQYQLGMLYAFGAGVPKQREYAAALFSMAGQQGHFEAQNMLESINDFGILWDHYKMHWNPLDQLESNRIVINLMESV